MSTQSKSPKPKGKGQVCVFCEQGSVCEETYGKLLSKAGVTAHYFCMLFSSGLSQNGKTEKQGILGFLQSDIMKEVKRGARLRCSYCRKIGATIGCVIRNCKKMFHLGCGRSNNTLHQFFGTFSSFCPAHRQQQDVPCDDDPNIVCSICMNTVTAAPSNDTIRAPCCRKYWYHRECVQRYATSAGLYFFKCPLCNNKEEFQDEMLTMGIYIPDQDASWEKEPHAFQELLERYGHCDAPLCKCVEGRKYDKEGSKWEIILCDFCGSHGAHVACNHLEKMGKHDICHGCKEVDERTREEEYLLHSPPHKRKSLELLQLELASSPETSKGTSPYPGPSNSMRKLGLPNSPTGKAKTKSGAKKGKRIASPENKASPPKLKKQRFTKASATVTSATAKRGRKEILLSPNTSSQSSEDSSDDDLPFSILKTKLQKMELENAWDVRRRKRMESQRKHAEKKQRNKNNEVESDTDVEVNRKVLNRKNRRISDIDSETDTATETIDKKVKNKKFREEANAINQKATTFLSDTETDSMKFKGQKKDMPNKRLSLAVTNPEKGIGHGKEIHSRMSLGAGSATTNSNVEKKKQGKLKKRSLENDKSQTTLTSWLKPKPKDENIEMKLSPEKTATETKKDKKPIVIEWRGKQLIIRSPRVALNRSRNRKVIKMKPKCLEIDMNDRKGSLDSNKDIDLLSNLETDIRVTRKMVDIDHFEAKAEKQVGRLMLPARDARKEENTETEITSTTKFPDFEQSNGNAQPQLNDSEGDRIIETDVKEKAETDNLSKPSESLLQGISGKKPLHFENSGEAFVDKLDKQFENDREDSPAKNLRVRKMKGGKTIVTSTDSVQSNEGFGMNIVKEFACRHSPGKDTVRSKPVLPQSPKSEVRTDSPAKNLRLRVKKDQMKTDSIEIIDINHLEQENQHTPTMQNKSCFNFNVKGTNSCGETLPEEKGSPLIRVKESAEFGSVIIINDTNAYKELETKVCGPTSDNNIERLKIYKPALPESHKLEDSPAKNLRKRSHPINKISETEICSEVDKVKEAGTQTIDSDSDNSAKSDQIERLKKYKPNVNYLNSANTTDVKGENSEGSVLDKVKETIKDKSNSVRYMNKQQGISKEQQNVVWHLEGTRQLENRRPQNNSGIYGAGCENTCPNPRPVSKGVDTFQEEGTTSAAKTKRKGFNVSDILGENFSELNNQLPTTVNDLCPQNELCNTADNLSPSYFTKFRRSCSKSESLESFSSKASGTDNNTGVKSTQTLQGDQVASFSLSKRNILNGVKNSSAIKQRSSPRSAKKTAASQPLSSHTSDKMSMAEYYGASLRTDPKEKINGARVVTLDDDDDDIVELPMFIGTSSIV
ncbi:uncharacterized protein LOC123536603 [Mercenaria mercenaria]|uniref:uncharacterized protein LOC123536603 n=1 Tax=Mercenaria mercenaria TaxID=6596 RepID=UPI00234F00DE|nr:uncharacterized protein LOC123536603 [Mercenaria mercenaria]